MAKRIVIVGCGLAGASAAESARKTDPNAEISIVERSSLPVYSRCGLPYLVGGRVKDASELILNSEDYFTDDLGANLLLNTTVEDGDVVGKNVEVVDEHGQNLLLRYDSLVLASGAFSQPPSIQGRGKPGVLVLRTEQDALSLRRLASSSGRLIVVGGGPVGLELAENLLKLGMHVTVVVPEVEVLQSIFEPEFGAMVRHAAEEHGVEFLLRSSVDRVLGVDRLEAVDCGGRIIVAKGVVFTTSLYPENALAMKLGLRLGDSGGIAVDRKMRTSVSDVYAAGDCVELKDDLTGRYRSFRLASLATRMGSIAGVNAAGGDAFLHKVLGNFSLKVFEVELSATGSNLHEARSSHIDCEELVGEADLGAKYLNPQGRMLSRLLFEKKTSKLIGAQFLGPGASAMGDLFTLAIQTGVTKHELAALETSFHPLLKDYWTAPALAARL